VPGPDVKVHAVVPIKFDADQGGGRFPGGCESDVDTADSWNPALKQEAQLRLTIWRMRLRGDDDRDYIVKHVFTRLRLPCEVVLYNLTANLYALPEEILRSCGLKMDTAAIGPRSRTANRDPLDD